MPDQFDQIVARRTSGAVAADRSTYRPADAVIRPEQRLAGLLRAGTIGSGRATGTCT